MEREGEPEESGVVETCVYCVCVCVSLISAEFSNMEEAPDNYILYDVHMYVHVCLCVSRLIYE